MTKNRSRLINLNDESINRNKNNNNDKNLQESENFKSFDSVQDNFNRTFTDKKYSKIPDFTNSNFPNIAYKTY